MKRHHVKWASEHDWFIESKRVIPFGGGFDEEYAVIVRGDIPCGDPETVTFHDYHQLREWAGY